MAKWVVSLTSDKSNTTIVVLHPNTQRGRRDLDPDRMVVGFTTTYAISAYHH